MVSIPNKPGPLTVTYRQRGTPLSLHLRQEMFRKYFMNSYNYRLL